ncbi:MAG: hypothetical protein ACXWNL_01340 [Vulcanimicrobiaceae bacterium]
MLCTALASARPVVKLHLKGVVVQQSEGRTSQTPVEGVVLKAGDLVRYTIAASNSGDSPALKLTPVGPVPKATSFVPGSARAAGAFAEFTLDGKTWSAHPMLSTKTPNGIVAKPADPSLYRAVRWITKRALPPKSVFVYSYDVRVNGHPAAK